MGLPLFSSHFSYHCSAIKVQRPPLTLCSATSRALSSPCKDTVAATFRCNTQKEKVVVIMGATGSGKSRLSIDLATRFPFSEIINADKMQVYKGLDITTNKIPVDKRNGVAHHLLGEVDPEDGEFTALDFRLRGGSVISDITSRHKLPIVVGGSNSLVHALLVDQFDPELDVFGGLSSSPLLAARLISSELRYKCCFLWVDVAFPMLSEYLMKRVDDMLDSGMVDELAEFFNSGLDDLEDDVANWTGLRKTIGVPEFERYFKEYPPKGGLKRELLGEEDLVRKAAYEEAVRAMKENPRELVKRQIWKILRLKEAGWGLQRLEATEALRVAMTTSGNDREGWSKIWEREVGEPSVKIPERFLTE